MSRTIWDAEPIGGILDDDPVHYTFSVIFQEEASVGELGCRLTSAWFAASTLCGS
jgi:hypothetical protein